MYNYDAIMSLDFLLELGIDDRGCLHRGFSVVNWQLCCRDWNTQSDDCAIIVIL